MAIERITTNEPTLNLADISSYPTESGTPITILPDGTIISCTVTARGIGEDNIWGTMDDVEIPRTTQSVTITDSATPAEPSFVPSSLSINLSDGDGTASIETNIDLPTGYTIEWVVEELTGGPIVPIETEPISNYNAAYDTGTRDFEGRYFVWGDSGLDETPINSNIDTYNDPIKNANFIIGVEREPTAEAAGVVEFDWEPEFLRNGDDGVPDSRPQGVATHVSWQLPAMWDPSSDIQDRPPQLSHWPPQPETLDSSYTVNPKWIPIITANDEFDAFGVSRDQGELLSWTDSDGDVYTYGFTVTEDYAKVLIKDGLNLECVRRGISEDAENRKLIMEGTKNGDGTVDPYYDILPTGMMIWGTSNRISSFFIVEYEEQDDGNIKIIFDIVKEGGIRTSYLHFALFGQGAWLLDKNHSFTLDLANKKIRYRYNQSTPPPQVFASKPKTSDLNLLSNGGFFARNHTAFENSSFTFSLNDFNTYLIRNNSGFDIKMTNCTVRFPYRAGSMTNYFEFVDSEMIWALQRGFSFGRTGCLLERSSFTGCEQSSANSYIRNTTSDANPVDGWGPWKIEKCIYNLLYSNHGQAMSSYQGSWTNFEIRDNIFLNCQRVASFNGEPGAHNSGEDPGVNWQDLSAYTFSGYVFENNLICHTRNLTTPKIAGQWGHAWNAKIDTDLFDSRQAKATIRNNTYIIAPHVEEDGWREDYGNRTYVGLQVASRDPAYASGDVEHPFKLTVEGNLGLLKEYREDAIVAGVDQNLYSNQNLWLKPTEVPSAEQTFSSTDLFSPKDTNTERELSYPDNLYYLYDIGVPDKLNWKPVVRSDVETTYQNVGIQWDNAPTFGELESLDKTWSSSVSFRTLPTYRDGTMTEPDQDNRPYDQVLIGSGSGVFSGPNAGDDYTLSSVENIEGNLFDLSRSDSVWCYKNSSNEYAFRGWLDTSDTGLLQSLYGDEPTEGLNRATLLEQESYVEIYFDGTLVAEKKQFGASANQDEYINFIGSRYTFYVDIETPTDALIEPEDGDEFQLDLFSIYPNYAGY